MASAEPVRWAQAKGGSFVGDNKDFFRFRLGEQAVIPAFEEAVQSMKARRGALCSRHAVEQRGALVGSLTAALGVQVGGVRRIIVPVELGYPNNDMNALGPRPLTFSVRAVRAPHLHTQTAVCCCVLPC